MIRTLFRTLLIVVVVVAIAAFFVGYRWASGGRATPPPDASVGTSGGAVDVDAAREAAADVGEKVARGANVAQQMAANAAITAKIKSKMALDDTIEAADINVDTAGGIVTLSGTVGSPAQRARAVQLATETEGVKSVVDHLTVQ